MCPTIHTYQNDQFYIFSVRIILVQCKVNDSYFCVWIYIKKKWRRKCRLDVANHMNSACSLITDKRIVYFFLQMSTLFSWTAMEIILVEGARRIFRVWLFYLCVTLERPQHKKWLAIYQKNARTWCGGEVMVNDDGIKHEKRTNCG